MAIGDGADHRASLSLLSLFIPTLRGGSIGEPQPHPALEVSAARGRMQSCGRQAGSLLWCRVGTQPSSPWECPSSSQFLQGPHSGWLQDTSAPHSLPSCSLHPLQPHQAVSQPPEALPWLFPHTLSGSGKEQRLWGWKDLDSRPSSVCLACPMTLVKCPALYPLSLLCKLGNGVLGGSVSSS